MLVLRFDRETLPGFVNQQSWLQPQGLELLSTGGAVLSIPYPEIKFVCFVRDFEQGEPRREMRTFSTRPKPPACGCGSIFATARSWTA